VLSSGTSARRRLSAKSDKMKSVEQYRSLTKTNLIFEDRKKYRASIKETKLLRPEDVVDVYVFDSTNDKFQKFCHSYLRLQHTVINKL
jgi:hypothetical protein